MILALSAVNDLELRSVDISAAFTNGDLDEDIYMQQPEGFHEGGSNKVFKLRTSLYGLKQSARQWNIKLHGVLSGMGYKQIEADRSVYIHLFLTSYHHHRFSKTHRFNCLLVRRLSSGVRTCTKRRLLLHTMTNQPGRGGAAARHAAVLPNAGQGSSAPPGARDTSNNDPNPGGIIHMTPEAYFARYSPSAAPLPAPSVQQLAPQCEQTPSPEPPSPAKRSRHGSPISSKANTPTPQPLVRDVSMGPPPGDAPIDAGQSSSNPTPPSHFYQALTGRPDCLLRESELVQDMVQHITAWFIKVDRINISDTHLT